MNPNQRISAAITSAAIALGASAGIADAAQKPNAYKSEVAGRAGQTPGSGTQVSSGYLGLAADQLRTRLKAGTSLADIATAEGKTASGLEDAIVSSLAARLDAKVAAGDLSAAQVSKTLSNVALHVAAIVRYPGV